MKCPCVLWPLENTTSLISSTQAVFARQTLCNNTVVPGLHIDELIFTPSEGDFTSAVGHNQVSRYVSQRKKGGIKTAERT